MADEQGIPGSLRRGASHCVTLRVHTQPYCPRCGVALTSHSTAVRCDTAWCLTCRDIPHDELDWLGIALASSDLSDTWTTNRGVRFWIPSRPWKDGLVELFLHRRRLRRELQASSDADDTLAEHALRDHERTGR